MYTVPFGAGDSTRVKDFAPLRGQGSGPTLFFADLALNPQVPTTPNRPPAISGCLFVCSVPGVLSSSAPAVWGDSSARPLLSSSVPGDGQNWQGVNLWGRLSSPAVDPEYDVVQVDHRWRSWSSIPKYCLSTCAIRRSTSACRKVRQGTEITRPFARCRGAPPVDIHAHSPVPDDCANIATMGLPSGTGNIRPGVMGDNPGEALRARAGTICAYTMRIETTSPAAT